MKKTKRKLTRAVINALGGEEMVDRSIEALKAARKAHALTENIGAPAANPLIEDILDNYDGYEVEEPFVPPKLEVAEQALQDIEMLKINQRVLQSQMADMGVAVKSALDMSTFANGEVQRLSEVCFELQTQMATLLASYPPPPESGASTLRMVPPAKQPAKRTVKKTPLPKKRSKR